MNHTFHLPDCTVILGPLGENLSAWLQTNPYSQVFVVADQHTNTHCLPKVPGIAGCPITVIGADQPAAGPKAGDSERYKTLATCEQIWKAMLDARLDRKALVINLGGGVVGDMGGFCAATYKRGVDFIQIPTTLLAMTDAAIGGKLGIDFQGFKNVIGVFKSPAAVFIDPEFLKTLPARELHSGFAEVIKHALIGDMALWQNILELQGNTLQDISTADWIRFLEASVAVKIQVVCVDPHEHGVRSLLNFGHTFGHAIESYFLHTDDPLTHGEAVAIGMLCELPTPDWEGLQPGQVGMPSFRGGSGVVQTVLRFFGHRPIPESAFATLWELMLQDKKNASGRVRIAVPDAEPFSMRMHELSREEALGRLLFYNRIGA